MDRSCAIFYWVPKNILTETYEGETSFRIRSEEISFQIKAAEASRQAEASIPVSIGNSAQAEALSGASEEKANVRIVNMLNGNIYELDEQHFYLENGYYYFKNIPITDTPILLDIGGFYHE